MDLDIKKAIASPFSEKKWYIKLIFPIIVTALELVNNPNLHISQNIILLTTFISVLPDIVLAGFFIQFQHNEIHNETPLLPFLNAKIKKYFIYGLYGLGITLIYIILGFVLFFVLPNLFKNLGIANTLVGSLSNIGLILGFIFLFFAINAYADYFKFKDAISIGRIFKLMSKVQPFDYFGFIFFAVGLTYYIKLSSSLNNIFLIFSPFVAVIIRLTIMNMSAQLYKIAKNKLENNRCIEDKIPTQENNQED